MTRAFRSLAMLAAIAMLVLAGCGGSGGNNLDPPEITYGEDVSEMGMFVTDPRYTVAALPEEGEWILFDDIGELFRYRVRHSEQAFQATWVNDYHSEEWLAAEDAWYLQSVDLSSPMGWGVAAFRDEDAARAFQVEHGGELMTWADTGGREWTDPPAPEGVEHEGH